MSPGGMECSYELHLLCAYLQCCTQARQPGRPALRLVDLQRAAVLVFLPQRGSVSHLHPRSW